MTDLGGLADPLRCPACGAPLPIGGTACPACGARLDGPLAARIWQVSTQADALLTERAALLDRLRRERPGWAPPLATAPGAAALPAAEVRPIRAQSVLLALGVLLLVVAAVIFAVVAWGRLGPGGRAVLLVGVTAVALGGAWAARRRDLVATAEALAVLGIGLLVVDAALFRLSGLFGLDGTPAGGFAGGTLAAVAGAAWVVGRRLDLGAGRISAVLLALLAPLPFAADVLTADATAAMLLAESGLAGPVRLWWRSRAAAAVPRLGRGAVPAERLVGVGAVLAWLLGVGTATVRGLDPVVRDWWFDEATEPRVVASLLLTLGATVAAAALVLAGRATGRWPRHLLAAGAAASVTAAGVLPALAAVPSERGPLVLALAGAVVGWGATVVPEAARVGTAVVGALTGVPALLALGEDLGAVVAGPLAWAGAAWTVDGRAGSRALLAPPGWAGASSFEPALWPVPVVLALGVAAVLVARALRTGLLVQAASAATAVMLALLLLPAAVDLPYAAGVAMLVGVGSLAAGLAAVADRPWAALPAGVTVVVGLGWSLAAPGPTILAFSGAALVAAAAVRPAASRTRPALLSACVLLAGGALLAGALHAGWPVARVGFAVAVAGGVVAAAGSHLLRPTLLRVSVEGSGAVVAAVGLALSANDPGWAAHTLVATAVAAALVAVRPDRRAAGILAGVLLTAGSWVRLAMAGIEAPEPYTVPPALALLVVGAWRRRHQPPTSSWLAYGGGVGLGLVPALVAAVADRGLLRPGLLGVAACAVLLVGVRRLLQAPLVLGGGVLAVDAVAQLWPYAQALPRWVTLGAAGLLLLVLGATYERRRRELARLTSAVRRMG